MKYKTRKHKYYVTWAGWAGGSWDLGDVKKKGPFLVRRANRG